MNGAHDLGGMHGLGPIKPEPEAVEPVFHEEWEKRVFGLTLAAGFLGRWNIDMSRHSRERQHPLDYLRHTYYENWLAGLKKLLVEAQLVNPQELQSGQAAGPANESVRQRVLKAEAVADAIAAFQARRAGPCGQPASGGSYPSAPLRAGAHRRNLRTPRCPCLSGPQRRGIKRRAASLQRAFYGRGIVGSDRLRP